MKKKRNGSRSKSKKLTRTDKLIIHCKCRRGRHTFIKFILTFPFIRKYISDYFHDRRKKQLFISSSSLMALLIVFTITVMYTISDRQGSYTTVFASDSGIFTVGYVYIPPVTDTALNNPVTPVPTLTEAIATPVPETSIPTPDISVFEITDTESLYVFAEKVNSGDNKINAILMSDIIIDASYGYWTPIADYGTVTDLEYNGNFDGNGFSISGIKSVPSVSHRGLFGYLGKDATVRNLTIKNCELYGTEYIGGIAAENYGTIINCKVSGVINTDENGILLGGITGTNNGYIEESESSCQISGGGYIGGIAGENYSNISGCINYGAISGEVSIGGIVGQNECGIISNCSTITEPAVSDDTGNGTATTGITGETGIGGIAGINSDDSIITGCSSAIQPEGIAGFGVIVGINYGTIEDSYKAESDGTANYDSPSLTGINYGMVEKTGWQ